MGILMHIPAMAKQRICPEIRSFPRFLALREIHRRPRTYLPMFFIYFGVMLLLFNLFIYVDSRIKSDILYYKVDTEWILPALTDTEISDLRINRNVKAVEAVADGNGSNTAFVSLIPETDHSIHQICSVLCETLSQMELWNRNDVYKNAKVLYDKLGADALSESNLVNTRYMFALSESLFQPSMIYLSLLSAGMIFAVTVFLYQMKLAQSVREYAVLRGMGMTMRTLRQMQFWQAISILTISYLLSLGLSLGTMAFISHLSKNLFPGYHGNTVLRMSIPWAVIVFLWFLWNLSVFLAVYLCTRMFQKRTITELSHGAGEEIAFVEKSDIRFLNSGGIARYETLWRKRSRKSLRRTSIMCLLLILFPGFLFSILLSMCMTESSWLTIPLTENEVYVYRLEPSRTEEGIPFSLLEELAALPGVERLYSRSYAFIPENTAMCPGTGTAYREEGSTVLILPLHSAPVLCDTPSPDMVWVGVDFPGEAGDAIRISIDGYASVEAVIEKKDPAIPGHDNWFRGYEYEVLLGENVYCSIYGTPEPLFDSFIEIIADTGAQSPDITLEGIEQFLGYNRIYKNEHDRFLHDSIERPYTVRNVYIENQIVEITETFLELFLLTEIVYLLFCAAAVIGSVTAFQLNRREREFATLRAMGVPKSELAGRITRFGCIPIVQFLPLLYPLFVLLSCIMDDNVRFVQNSITLEWHFEGMQMFIGYLIGDLTAVVILAVLYLGTAYFVGIKTGKSLFTHTLTESIRNGN